MFFFFGIEPAFLHYIVVIDESYIELRHDWDTQNLQINLFQRRTMRFVRSEYGHGFALTYVWEFVANWMNVEIF